MHELGVCQREHAFGVHEQMVVRRRHVNHALAHASSMPCFHHRQRRAAAQDFGHQRAVPRVEVLHYKDRDRKIARQRAKHQRKGVEALPRPPWRRGRSRS